MPHLELRDRDAILTNEGVIFRVLGYAHPEGTYVCDPEYASAKVFRSRNPKAIREKGSQIFYKFYEDEGWNFIKSKLPKYMIFHDMLRKEVVGVGSQDHLSVLKPEVKLRALFEAEPADELVTATQKLLEFISCESSLSIDNFGVFGSMLHDFHHPKFSDIDIIIYGRKETNTLKRTLKDLYTSHSPMISNEFETNHTIKDKPWSFQNLSADEYVQHQHRKAIYALFKDEKSQRIIKTEFEPVKDWSEIQNEYDPMARVAQRGWVRMVARVTDDADGPFIPSIYGVEPIEVLGGAPEALEVRRIVTYLEEFRSQANIGETVYVEGNLEEITVKGSTFSQVVLTYCPEYYKQVLKVL